MRHARLHRRDDTTDCSPGGGSDAFFGLRVASVFIILATSMTGALFPVLTRRSKIIAPHIPKSVYQTAKYFGSGVIIATAFIHLLDPATQELTSPCLGSAWEEYPYALAIALCSIFTIFILELVAFRWGTAKLAKLGITHDAHGHGVGGHAAHGPENQNEKIVDSAVQEVDTTRSRSDSDPEKSVDLEAEAIAAAEKGVAVDNPAAQIIGVAILEFGVLLHSVLIGLTLAVDAEFKILFIVIVFHQMFEGLGVGSRLAYLKLPYDYRHAPVIGALLYGITTPIGIAAGLGVRTTYNPNTATASVVSGVLDAFSAGILIYTGLVELLAHEFLFNKEMQNAPNKTLAFAIGCMLAGAGIMALLGKWA